MIKYKSFFTQTWSHAWLLKIVYDVQESGNDCKYYKVIMHIEMGIEEFFFTWNFTTYAWLFLTDA